MRARHGRAVLALSAAALLGGAACESRAEADGGIDREVFVATYVDLRAAALRTPSAELTPAAKERVLREHGVSEEELLEFAEIHGEDPELMRGVWEDVEARLEAMQGPADSAR